MSEKTVKESDRRRESTEASLKQLGNIIYGQIKNFEKLIMKQFDRVSAISDKMLERLSNNEIPSPLTTLLINEATIPFLIPSP